MKLRVIKKDIEYFVGEFIDDCTLFTMLNPAKAEEKVGKIIEDAIALYNDLKAKVSALPEELSVKAKAPADKIRRSKQLRAYYNGLREEMFSKLDNLCERLSAVASKS